MIHTFQNDFFDIAKSGRNGFEVLAIGNVFSLHSKHVPESSSDDLSHTGDQTEKFATAKSLSTDWRWKSEDPSQS